jgi:hypothetical protein
MAKPSPVVVPLTEARAQLFRLAEELLSGRLEQVRLSHRSHADDLVLLRASTLQALEGELARLSSNWIPAPRPLAGLATLHPSAGVSFDSVLRDSREEAQARFEAKMERLARAEADAVEIPQRVAEPRPARGYAGRTRRR